MATKTTRKAQINRRGRGRATEVPEPNNRTEFIKETDARLEADGKCTVTRAALILGKPRSYLYNMIRGEELQRDADGNLYLDEVHAIARGESERKNQTGLDVVSQGLQATLESQREMVQLMISGVRTLVETTNGSLRATTEQLEKIRERESQVLDELRKLHEEKVREAEAGRQGERVDQMLGMITEYAPKFLMASSAGGKLKAVLETLNPEQTAQLMQILTPGQLGQLEKVVGAIEGVSDDSTPKAAE